MHVCVNMHETKYFVFIYLFTYRLNKLVCGEKRRESRISVCFCVWRWSRLYPPEHFIWCQIEVILGLKLSMSLPSCGRHTSTHTLLHNLSAF